MENRGLLYAVFTALLWGFLAIGLKVTNGWLDSVTVVWIRFVIAFASLLLWMFLTGREGIKRLRKPSILVILTALFLGLNYYGFMEGLRFTSPSNAQVFIQLGPVGFALVGIIVYREKINWKSVAGFILVLAGLFLFYHNQLNGLKGSLQNYRKGIYLLIGGALAWTLFASLQKKLLAYWDANLLNLMIYAVCALMYLPLADMRRLFQMNFGQWMLIISLGLNTVLSYGFLALAIKYAEANRVSVVITLNPIITFVAMTVLGVMGVTWIAPENFNIYSIFGAVIALTGAVTTILSRRPGR